MNSRRVLSLFYVTLLFCVFCARAQAETKVWIMWGQSNMFSGLSGELPEAYVTVPHNVEYWASIKQGEAQSFTSFKKQELIGPEVGFAHTIAKQYFPDDSHLIIKVAVGATDMSRWTRGGDLYSLLLQTVKTVVGNRDVRYMAVIGCQGEADSNTVSKYLDYRPMMNSMMRGIRSELGDPYLMWGITLTNPPTKYAFEINAEQLRIVQTDVNARAISTIQILKDPCGQGAELHYTTMGQIELGRRMAYSMVTH